MEMLLASVYLIYKHHVHQLGGQQSAVIGQVKLESRDYFEACTVQRIK